MSAAARKPADLAARSSRRADVLARLPIVFGLGDVEAAAAIGLGVSKFRAMVDDGRMPRPRKADGRLLWDVDELRVAFKSLPREGGEERADSWNDF